MSTLKYIDNTKIYQYQDTSRRAGAQNRTLVAALCAAAIVASTAGTAGAATDTGPVHEEPDGTDIELEGEGIEDLDVPEDYVEEMPPPNVIAKLRHRPYRVQRTVGRGTDGHYCGSWYIWHISYTHKLSARCWSAAGLLVVHPCRRRRNRLLALGRPARLDGRPASC